MHDEQPELLAEFWPVIFGAQLEAWHRDPRDWPAKRSLEMFKEWFDIEFHDEVLDLLEAPVEKTV